MSSKTSSPASTTSLQRDDLDYSSSVDDSEDGKSGDDNDSRSDEESGSDTGGGECQEKSIGRKRKHEGDEIERSDGEMPTTSAPVLSHAEKRRQKRREQDRQEKQTGAVRTKESDSDINGIGGPSKETNSSPKRNNSVWVGNLSYKTTLDDLKTFFAWTGEITRINMPTKVPPGPGRKPENRGFAYVDFSTPEAKAAAIALSERPLIGRKLLIKDGDDFTGRPKVTGSAGVDGAPVPKTHSKTAQKILNTQKQPSAPTLFLGNLGFETTDADIVEMLCAHQSAAASKKQADSGADGKREKAKEVPSTQSTSWIRKVRMGTFEDSGLCKGFAFVDFVSIEDATSALINPKNYFLNGRKLVIEYASPDAVRRGMPKAKQTNKEGLHKKKDDAPEYEEIEQHAPKRQRVDEALNSNVQQRDKRWIKGPNKGPKFRKMPGAALASAQRESVAIMPSQGKKIKFD